MAEVDPRQLAVEGNTETMYKPIASIDQTDIDFFIPGNSETYIDLDLKLLIKGKLMKEDNTQLTDTGYTAGINNLLHSLQSMQHFFERHSNNTGHRFIQLSCIPGNTLNLWKRCCRITPQKCSLAPGQGNMKDGDTTKPNETNNDGYVQRWNRMKKADNRNVRANLF